MMIREKRDRGADRADACQQCATSDVRVTATIRTKTREEKNSYVRNGRKKQCTWGARTRRKRERKGKRRQMYA